MKYEHVINFFNSIKKDDRVTTVGKPKSNWRVKVYPKPRIWVNKDTLKELIMDSSKMSKERFKWYQKEIQRLKELDNKITDKVRATYTLTKKKKKK